MRFLSLTVEIRTKVKAKRLIAVSLCFICLFLSHSLLAQAPVGNTAESKTLLWSDGTRYVGTVIDGKKDGKGVIFWSNGARFEGQFVNDMRSGAGKLILGDGSEFSGFYENDELISVGVKKEQHSRIISVEVEQELIEVIDAWGEAWSDQNAINYFRAYSDNFQVPPGSVRSIWEKSRENRINEPEYINLEISYEGFKMIDSDNINAYFKQNYESNLYSSLSNKILTLQKGSAGWKIIHEETILTIP